MKLKVFFIQKYLLSHEINFLKLQGSEVESERDQDYEEVSLETKNYKDFESLEKSEENYHKTKFKRLGVDDSYGKDFVKPIQGFWLTAFIVKQNSYFLALYKWLDKSESTERNQDKSEGNGFHMESDYEIERTR